MEIGHDRVLNCDGKRGMSSPRMRPADKIIVKYCSGVDAKQKTKKETPCRGGFEVETQAKKRGVGSGVREVLGTEERL